MMAHLIFKGAGTYSPTVCPRTILWQRVDDDPICGVFVPHKHNAALFAQVMVVDENGKIVETILQEEKQDGRI